MSFNPIKLGPGMKLLPDGTVDVDPAKLPSISVPPATATDAGLLKVPAGGGLVVGNDGALRVDGKVPSASSGTPALSAGLVDGATGDTWTIQQQFNAALADSGIIQRIATALSSTFAPFGSSGSGGTTPPPYTITVDTPAPQTAQTSFRVTGTYANGTLASIDYNKTSDEANWITIQTATIDNGIYSFSTTLFDANPNQVIRVRDSANPSVIGTSAPFTVAAAVDALTVVTPTQQIAGTAFNINGSYSGSVPPSLEYSKDGEATWLPASATINSSNYVFSVTLNTVGTGRTISVRNTQKPSVKVVTGVFDVVAAAAPQSASAYTITKRTQDMTTLSVPNDGSYQNGGFITLYAVKTSDGTPAPSLKVTYSTSQTVAPPAGNFAAMSLQNLSEPGAPSNIVFSQQFFYNAPGTYYYWAQDSDGVTWQLSMFEPMVVS